ncbi:MAG: Gfo/Idh/MocA family oxidoreductase [Anaerolineae bacterium]
METRSRAGLIGCGRIGTLLDDEVYDALVRDNSWRNRPCTFAGNFVQHPRTRLVAAADLNPRRLERARAKWGDINLYADYREMLLRERLDIVAIATPSSLHCEMTVVSAQAGVRAIFCEKPIADSLTEADSMIDACNVAGSRLIINHTFRFHPDLHRARELIEQGRIGELRTIVCHFPRWLIHMGAHMFDLMAFFAGEPEAVMGRLDHDTTEDTEGAGCVWFKSGVRALVDAQPRTAFGYLDLMGTGGAVRFRNDTAMTFELWLPGASGQLEQQPFPSVAAEVAARGPSRGRFVCATGIDEVVACLDEGRESYSNGRHGRTALELAHGFYASHFAGGRAVTLPNSDRLREVPEALPPEVFQAQAIF